MLRPALMCARFPSSIPVWGIGAQLSLGAACCAPTDVAGDDTVVNLVFTGAMDYHANVDAVVWFCSDILPRLTRAGINAHFSIVGGRPAAAVQALSQNPRVTVTGFVDDIRPWYAKADVCVIPLRLARGVQNKVLEAMAMEKPVVTTSDALGVVGATHAQHLLVADDAESIAAAVIELCRNADARRELGQAGRKFVVEHFDWRRNMDKLENLI